MTSGYENAIDAIDGVLNRWIRFRFNEGLVPDSESVRSEAIDLYRRIIDTLPIQYRTDAAERHKTDGFRIDDETCRICLAKNSPYGSVFDYFQQENVQISDMITSITSIELKESNAFPNIICLNCFQILKSAYAFRKQCYNSENILKYYRNREAVNADIKEELAEVYTDNQCSDDDKDILENLSTASTDNFDPLQVRIKEENFTNNILLSCNRLNTSKPGTAKNRASQKVKLSNKLINVSSKIGKNIKKLKYPHTISKNVFKCKSCNFKTKFRSERIAHVKKHHKSKNVLDDFYTCDVCEYKSCHYATIKNHIASHANETKIPTNALSFACDKCNYFGKTIRLLKKHLNKHSSDSMYMCDKCEYVSKWKSCLINHMIKHNTERKYACDKCDHTSKTSYHLNRHMIKHEIERKHTCDKCDYAAKTKEELKRHRTRHETGNSRKHPCDKCDFGASTNSSLKRHMMRHESERRYPCDVCNYAAVFRSDLKKHMIIHADDRKYACDKCPYTSKDKYGLSSHMNKHRDERKFTCDKCDYAAKTRGDLNKHTIKHDTERRYMCDKCGYSSKRKPTLVAHMIVHDSEKRFACDKCEYAAKSAHRLKRHAEIHESEKKYTCTKCEYASKTKNCLYMHMIKHDADRNYACGKCDFAFKRKKDLKRHLERCTRQEVGID